VAIAGLAFFADRFQMDVLVLRSLSSSPNLPTFPVLLFLFCVLACLRFVCTHAKPSANCRQSKPLVQTS
jgi:hypothetical protein